MFERRNTNWKARDKLLPVVEDSAMVIKIKDLDNVNKLTTIIVSFYYNKRTGECQFFRQIFSFVPFINPCPAEPGYTLPLQTV